MKRVGRINIATVPAEEWRRWVLASFTNLSIDMTRPAPGDMCALDFLALMATLPERRNAIWHAYLQLFTGVIFHAVHGPAAVIETLRSLQDRTVTNDPTFSVSARDTFAYYMRNLTADA